MKFEAPGFWKRTLSYLSDWGIALALSAVVFWGLTQWQQPNVPEIAPLWTLPSTDGKAVSLENFKGKTVVLSFWATYCGVCRQEAPSMSAFSQTNPDVVVLGMAADGNPRSLERVAKSWGMTYPIVMTSREVIDKYNVKAFPTTVVIDPDGNTLNSHTGKLSSAEIESLTQGRGGCN